jgi:hypothetical protein
MGLFNAKLLINVLEGIVEEIERVDLNSPALAQLRYLIEQKSAEIEGAPSMDDERPLVVGPA